MKITNKKNKRMKMNKNQIIKSKKYKNKLINNKVYMSNNKKSNKKVN